MQPAPATIAAPPRPSSQASCSPAVPPPPVAGATAGNGPGDRVLAGDRCARGLGVAAGLPLAPPAGPELPAACDGVAGRGVGVLAAAEWAGPVGADVAAVAPGDNFGSVALGADPLQAATDAAATIVSVAKPAAVSPARIPVVAVRAFIRQP